MIIKHRAPRIAHNRGRNTAARTHRQPRRSLQLDSFIYSKFSTFRRAFRFIQNVFILCILNNYGHMANVCVTVCLIFRIPMCVGFPSSSTCLICVILLMYVSSSAFSCVGDCLSRGCRLVSIKLEVI